MHLNAFLAIALIVVSLMLAYFLIAWQMRKYEYSTQVIKANKQRLIVVFIVWIVLLYVALLIGR